MSDLPRLGKSAVDLLESIHQHRLISTRQLHTLHHPGRSLRWTQHTTTALQRHGLIADVRAPGAMKLHYLTATGADAVEVIGSRTETRRKLVGPGQAAGPLQQHTLAVNDVGVCFVQAARQHHDECGAWAWRHEIAHPIGAEPGRRRLEQVISDALLTYQRIQPGQTSFHYRLVELDRATMPVDDLAAKLARYARLYHHTLPSTNTADEPAPWWTHRYSVFPTVLVVLANHTRRRLERRRHTLLALCAQDQQLQHAPQVRIDVCLLQDLQQHGPFATIFHSSADPQAPVNWLGQADEG